MDPYFDLESYVFDDTDDSTVSAGGAPAVKSAGEGGFWGTLLGAGTSVFSSVQASNQAAATAKLNAQVAANKANSSASMTKVAIIGAVVVAVIVVVLAFRGR